MALSPQLRMQMIHAVDMAPVVKSLEAVERLGVEDPRLIEALLSQLGPEALAGKTPPPPAPPMSSAGKEGGRRMAGTELVKGIMNFANSPIGEEVIEGTLMGTVAAVPGFFQQDKDPRETALQWLGAVGGGIGLGIGARRIGAGMGKALHPGRIENEELAAFARMAGQEKLSTGVNETLRDLAARASRGRRSQAVDSIGYRLASMDDEAFAAAHPQLAQAGILPSTATPELKQRLSAIGEGINAHADELQNEAVLRAAQTMDEEMAKAPEEVKQLLQGQGVTGDALVKAMTEKPEEITGEHIGRMAGRFIGDEIGVLLGMGAGGLAANALGYQSSKDKEIERLKAQLLQRQS